jgi:quercetin dioxygenase-like cupin family protein
LGHALVPLPEMPWQPGAHPLEHKKVSPDFPWTLLSFGPGFVDPHWCLRGHAGYILRGRLTLEFEDATLQIKEGEAFRVDPGIRHQASNRGPDEVLLLISSESPG